MKIKKGDNVQIITGKDAGKTGSVERVMVKTKPNGQVSRRVLIAGANIVTRHQKNQQNRQGGRVEMPAPIDISNVMLVCPHCKLKTRVGYRVEGEKKVRICKKCQKSLDK